MSSALNTTLGLAVTTVALAVCHDANSQIPDAVIETARAQELATRRPGVFFAVERDGSWDLTSIYFRPFERNISMDAGSPRYWIARRIRGRGDQAAQQVEWADSRLCPQMEGALWWLGSLPLPSMSIPGFAVPQPSTGGPETALAVHAPTYTVWGAAMTLDHPNTETRMSARWGDLAEWGAATERHMTECWTAQEPSS